MKRMLLNQNKVLETSVTLDGLKYQIDEMRNQLLTENKQINKALTANTKIMDTMSKIDTPGRGIKIE